MADMEIQGATSVRGERSDQGSDSDRGLQAEASGATKGATATEAILDSGKHMGKTFAQVLDTDPMYVGFLSKWRSEGKPMKKCYKDFLSYVAQLPDWDYETEVWHFLGKKRITKGKFMGKSFEQVMDSTEGEKYVAWIEKRIQDNEPTSYEFRQLVQWARGAEE